MAGLLQPLFDAISLGSIYALGALGIALIFGVMRLINFAHGQYIAFCVFALLIPSTEVVTGMLLGALPSWLIVLSVLGVGALLSIASEVVVFRRLRNANPAVLMIASFALGIVIQNVLLVSYSSRPKSVSLWPELSLPVELFGASIPLLQVLTVLVTIVLLLGLVFFLKRTHFGLEMRAAAENFTMARMLGVRANRIILLAFGISGALAGTIALVLVSQTGTADIRMGLPIMLIAFVATVIGGMGSLQGAVLAGFLLGAASVTLQLLLPLDIRPFRDAFLYLAVIACLIWRPEGLFRAGPSSERV